MTMSVDHEPDFTLDADLYQLTQTFGDRKSTPFQNAGFMKDRKVWTRGSGLVPRRTRDAWQHPRSPRTRFRAEFFIAPDKVEAGGT